MPYYLFQVSYKPEQLKALIEHPQDRSVAARKSIEAHGGKLHEFFYAFGEYDAVVTCEFPNNESAAASVLAIASTGGFSKFQTTVLMTMDEALKAMDKAGSVKSGYKPPAGS